MARPSYGDPLSRERPSTVGRPPPAASSCAGAAGDVCFTGGAAAPTGSPATGIDIPGTIGFRTRHAAGPTDDARHVGWPALALSRARLLDLHSGRPVWRPGRIGRPRGAHGIRGRSRRRSAPIVSLSDTTRRRWLGGSP